MHPTSECYDVRVGKYTISVSVNSDGESIVQVHFAKHPDVLELVHSHKLSYPAAFELIDSSHPEW